MTHTVIAILDAKKGMEHDLEAALHFVAIKSRLEKTNLEYRIHKSIDNPSTFVLYEKWENKEKHQEQFNKSYIIDFSRKITNLLEKPYQVIFASELIAAS